MPHVHEVGESYQLLLKAAGNYQQLETAHNAHGMDKLLRIKNLPNIGSRCMCACAALQYIAYLLLGHFQLWTVHILLVYVSAMFSAPVNTSINYLYVGMSCFAQSMMQMSRHDIDMSG